MTQFRLATKGRLEEVYQLERRHLARATTFATRRAGTQMRQKLKADTAAALGSRVGNTWSRPQHFPSGNRFSLEAATVVFSKAPRIIIAHEAERTLIRPQKGRWLAIPTRHAPQRGRGRFNRTPLTPATYRAAFGVNLRFVQLGSDRAMLVDPNLQQRGGGRRGGRGGAGAGLGRRGAPVFWLRRGVTLRRRLNVRRTHERALSQLVNELVFFYNFSEAERGRQLAG